MSALVTGLGHAMVSGGLGAPGASAVVEAEVDPCPIVHIVAAEKTSVLLHAASLSAIIVHAAGPTLVTLTADCAC